MTSGSSVVAPCSPARPADALPNGAQQRGLTCPTVLEGLRELAAVVGPGRALEQWALAAAATDLHGLLLTPDEHATVLHWLADRSPHLPVRAVARSVLARLRAYRVLAAREGSSS